MKAKQKWALTRAATVNHEMRVLAESPAFQALLEAGRASPATPLEELDRRLGPLTDAEKSRAAAQLRAIERLEAEQDAEVSAEQDRLIELVLAAAEHARGHASLAQLAAESDLSEAAIRATAMALKMVGVRAPRRAREGVGADAGVVGAENRPPSP